MPLARELGGAVSERVRDAYLSALDGMARRGPKGIHQRANADLDDDPDVRADDQALQKLLSDAGPDDALRRELHTRIATWDHADDSTNSGWFNGSAPNTPKRRSRILELLEVTNETAELLNALFPIVNDESIIIAEKFTPWFSPELMESRSFYWRHYSGLLQESGKFSPLALAKLDLATNRVVERLTKPSQAKPYQAKGLVVGYVQSGKTANFTGVVAKAIDLGYRLVIVLTGTTDLLRTQTQRRLDMELVGRENILRGVDSGDAEALKDVDYQDDVDWLNNKFVSHGGRPSELGRHPDLHRLTTKAFDYRSLKQGIAALDFERRDRTKLFHEEINLFASDARLLVVKKNASILGKFVSDLKKITARVADIPVLIIDDESDQASVNTSNPKKWAAGKTERTAINGHLSRLLEMLPRAQYVGYTATPFANVFIDPSDALDMFPRDFMLSLERPEGYMGAEDFHDFDDSVENLDEFSPQSKNKDAHVRLRDSNTESDLLEALDCFVLAGAIKLYREQHHGYEFKHHTMLIHEAMKTAEHRAQADRVRQAWRRAGYLTGGAKERLEERYEVDFLPFADNGPEVYPMPESFEELWQYIGTVASRIGHSNNPVLVVNSDKDLEQEEIDFDKKSVWRILLGGNKLARGFTVEGLTTSYYRRRTNQADTLMQMGRWFGFRRGYRDLVRLYTTPALYDAFESICLDERYFQNELKQYATLVNGEPAVTPAEIPPLVASHMLRPTAASKMYNAVLTVRRSLSKEPSSGYPAVNDRKALRENIVALGPLLQVATRDIDKSNPYCGISFRSKCGILSHQEVVGALSKLNWANEESFRADLAWLKELGPDRLADWLIVMPQPAKSSLSYFEGSGPFGLHGRVCSDNRIRGNSDSGHRIACRTAADRSKEKRGYFLLYPVIDKERLAAVRQGAHDPNGVVMAVSLQLPGSARPLDGRFLTFTARDSSQPQIAIVDGD
jgi:hypothetical protein